MELLSLENARKTAYRAVLKILRKAHIDGFTLRWTLEFKVQKPVLVAFLGPYYVQLLYFACKPNGKRLKC